MMGPEEAELKALQGAFKAAWDKEAYPFVLGDTPSKGFEAKHWVRLTILHGPGDRADLGGSTSQRYEFPGVITVQCHIVTNTPATDGQVKGPEWIVADITQRVRAIFQDKQFVTATDGHIICQTTSYQRVSKLLSDKSSWLRYDVTTPFRREEFHS